MGKLLENLINKEIEEAISILKRKNLIGEVQQDNVAADLTPLADDSMGIEAPPAEVAATGDVMTPEVNSGNADPASLAMPDATGGEVPSDDPGAVPSDDAENPTEEQEQEPEEEEDPIIKAFNNIETLSKQTEDITKIIKAIKATIQDNLSMDELQSFIDKVNDEGSPIMKKAFTRPELSFLKK